MINTNLKSYLICSLAIVILIGLGWITVYIYFPQLSEKQNNALSHWPDSPETLRKQLTALASF